MRKVKSFILLELRRIAFIACLNSFYFATSLNYRV